MHVVCIYTSIPLSPPLLAHPLLATLFFLLLLMELLHKLFALGPAAYLYFPHKRGQALSAGNPAVIVRVKHVSDMLDAVFQVGRYHLHLPFLSLSLSLLFSASLSVYFALFSSPLFFFFSPLYLRYISIRCVVT